MGNDYIVEYANFIETLSERSFNRLVVEFEKEYWDSTDVRLNNGPYDGGNDLVVVINKEEMKNTVQITTQKEYSAKLKKDIDKALYNVNQFGYRPVLDFFISVKISPKKKNELIRDAMRDKGIALNIYDANYFASEVNVYQSIRETLTALHKEMFPKVDFTLDDGTKVLYDTLSLSRNVNSLKANFVQSLILSYLYQNNSSTVKKMYDSLKSVFYNNLTYGWFGSVVGKLKSQNLIEDVGGFSPKEYALTDNYLAEIKNIVLKSQMAEQQLREDIKNVLSSYKVVGHIDEIAEKLYALYDENYKFDETEFLKKSRGNIKTSYQSLIKCLENVGVCHEKSSEVASRLLEICSNNNFINKVSVSKMFLTLFKSQKLEAYLSENPRDVYFDTQVLLRIICSKSTIEEFDNNSYNDISTMFKSIESSSAQINMYTTDGYVSETAGHIIEAIKLERFLDLPYIKSMGRSQNVIFNLFLEFRNKKSSLKFSDFIKDSFGIDISNLRYDEFNIFMNKLTRILRSRFEMLGITVLSIPQFINYEKYKKEYENIYSYISSKENVCKTPNALYNDLNTILLLSKDYQPTTDCDFKEPFLITWDQTFYKFRKDMNKRFSELGDWYIYTPLKFANTLSVLNFKIDANAINYNIVSIVEDRFNLSNDNISFMDLLNSFYSDKDISDWTLAGRLSQMRQELIDEQAEDSLIEATLPIDEFLMNIYQYYVKSNNSHGYKDIVALFTNNDFVDDIVTIISENLDAKFDMRIVSKFDALIDRISKVS